MLVTIEGLDGSGKTTVWEALREEYSGTFTREPTRSWYGDAVRRSIRTDDADSLAELFLYTADHADHLTSVIEPALADDELVISDRYIDSRYAYQAATLTDTLASPMAYIKRVHDPFTRYPDLTLYLDVDPETAVERSDRANKFEQFEYLQAVQDNYETLLADDADRFVRIDASAPLETVIEQAISAIDHHR